MKTRLTPAILAVSFLCAGLARGQSPTNTPTPQRTPTPTPTSIRMADLSITKTAAPNPVPVGQDLTYTLTVHNAGPNFAGLVVVRDELPSGVSVVSVSAPPQWDCSSDSTNVLCTRPLFFGGTEQIVIVVKPTAEGSLTNTAVVSCSFFTLGCIDPDLSNNSAAVTTQAELVLAFLHGSPTNPPALFLDGAAPAAAAAKHRDSGTVRAGLTNPWVEVGTWPAQPDFFKGSLTDLGELHVWVGLKNSDDQGTQFALRGEVWKNGQELVAAGETACVAGLIRDPARARDVKVPLNVFAPVAFDGTTDVMSLKVWTRIGTGCPGPSHTAATGLRLYFDSIRTPSGF